MRVPRYIAPGSSRLHRITGMISPLFSTRTDGHAHGRAPRFHILPRAQCGGNRRMRNVRPSANFSRNRYIACLDIIPLYRFLRLRFFAPKIGANYTGSSEVALSLFFFFFLLSPPEILKPYTRLYTHVSRARVRDKSLRNKRMIKEMIKEGKRRERIKREEEGKGALCVGRVHR